MKKKICFFSGDITRSGGTERVAVQLANGLMEENIEANGKMENSMEKENFIMDIKKFGEKVFGKMEKESVGFIMKTVMKMV